MPSRLLLPGLMAPVTVVEAPDVVERIINNARDDIEHDSPYVTLTHMVQLTKVEEGPVPGQVTQSMPFDSYSEVKIKYEYVMAIRGLHEEEEP